MPTFPTQPRIIHQLPARRPLLRAMGDSPISCASPAKGDNPYVFSGWATRTVAFRVTEADLPGTVFPVVSRIASFDFNQFPVGIVALAMTSSLICEEDGACGLIVSLDIGASYNLNGATDNFLSHLTEQNSTASTRAASSRTNSFHMGEGSKYPLDAGKILSIYGCAPSTGAGVGNVLSAIVTAYYVP